MRRKRVWVGLCSLTLIALLGTGSALAATTAENGADGQRGKLRLEDMTEEQKAQMEERRAEMESQMQDRRAEMESQMQDRRAEMEARISEQQAKWDGLTEAEKQRIFTLQQQQVQTQQQLLDTYYELGLIDEEQAERMQAMLAEMLAAIENGDKQPFMDLHLGGAGGIPKDVNEDGFAFGPGMYGGRFFPGDQAQPDQDV